MSAEEVKKSTAAASAEAKETSPSGDASTPATPASAPKKKRGRPSKAELAARAAADASASVEAPAKKAVKETASVQQQDITPKPAAEPKPAQETTSVQQQDSAPKPATEKTGTTGVPPVASPAQPSASQPGEQPMSNRQRRRMEWLARAAQRNGNRPNFKGGGKFSPPPQGNRRPAYEVPQNLPPPVPAVPRNPDLPEYNLQDIHTWDNADIVAKMCWKW